MQPTLPCTGSSIGRVAVSKTACWGFESLPVCHFLDDPFLAELVDALGSELSVFGHPGSTPGERTNAASQRGYW